MRTAIESVQPSNVVHRIIENFSTRARACARARIRCACKCNKYIPVVFTFLIDEVGRLDSLSNSNDFGRPTSPSNVVFGVIHNVGQNG